MRNISYKIRREDQNTHFVSNDVFSFENPAFCEIMWKNTVQPDSPQMTTQLGASSLHVET